jgi:hypothetical protein
VVRRWVPDDEGGAVGDLHGPTLSQCLRCAAVDLSTGHTVCNGLQCDRTFRSLGAHRQ